MQKFLKKITNCMERNWNFWRVGGGALGYKPKQLSGGAHGYFLEQHNFTVHCMYL